VIAYAFMANPCLLNIAPLMALLGVVSAFACGAETTSAANGATGGTSSLGGNGASRALGGSTTSPGGAGSSVGGSTTQGGATAAGTKCDQSRLLCKMLAPSCPVLQVPEMNADGTCYSGNCVAIDNCTCSMASECPDNNQYTCNLSARHCTPYLN